MYRSVRLFKLSHFDTKDVRASLVYNPLTRRALPMKSKQMERWVNLGFQPSKNSSLYLENEYLFWQLANELLAIKFSGEGLKSLLKPLGKYASQTLSHMVHDSNSATELIDQLHKYLDREAQEYCRRQSQSPETIDFGIGGDSIGERVDLTQLTTDQRIALEIAKLGYNLYLGGSAGTGKTVVLREIVNTLRHERKFRIAVTASTGVAAANINGYTFHHLFGLDGLLTTHLKNLDAILIDEVSMIQSELLAHLDIAARATRKNSMPFGGIQLILCGDFLQLGGIPNHPLFYNDLFMQHFVHVKLTTIHRLAEQQNEFSHILKEVRYGQLPSSIFNCVKTISSNEELPEEPDAIYIFPRNEDVLRRNSRRLALLPGSTQSFPSQLGKTELIEDWTPKCVIQLSEVEEKIGSSLADLKRRVAHEMEKNRASENEFRDIVLSVYPLDLDNAQDLRCAIRAKVLSVCIEDEARRAEVVETATLSVLQGLRVSLSNMGYETLSEVATPDDIPIHIQTRLQERARKELFYEPLGLRVGARVMLRWNLSRTLVNGSVGIVEGYADPSTQAQYQGSIPPRMYEEVPKYMDFLRTQEQELPLLPLVRFNNNELVLVPPLAIPVGGDVGTEYYSTYLLGIPLQLAYAFTVHKVQGLTLTGNVILDLTKMFSCPHLLYVALSRVRNPKQLIVKALDAKWSETDPMALAFDQDIPGADNVDMKSLPVKARAMLNYHSVDRK